MRKAEELAKWHEAMAAEPKRNEGKRRRSSALDAAIDAAIKEQT